MIDVRIKLFHVFCIFFFSSQIEFLLTDPLYSKKSSDSIKEVFYFLKIRMKNHLHQFAMRSHFSVCGSVCYVLASNQIYHINFWNPSSINNPIIIIFTAFAFIHSSASHSYTFIVLRVWGEKVISQNGAFISIFTQSHRELNIIAYTTDFRFKKKSSHNNTASHEFLSF